MLEWSVESSGLSITFFKVQYKDLSVEKRKRRWRTIDDDIPHINRMYEVTHLRPGNVACRAGVLTNTKVLRFGLSHILIQSLCWDVT